jgi:hypothetical protein
MIIECLQYRSLGPVFNSRISQVHAMRYLFFHEAKLHNLELKLSQNNFYDNPPFDITLPSKVELVILTHLSHLTSFFTF